ncbi:ImmA/IrrE family metallo-endopeptidase [Leptolyngbya ohadii]|uniref:ImmA/IrrE family metallo-endopeptidase n=1 Tax=Leptolyngbya ohadii TaxID=1962290 RepID=UPI001179EDC4|nr:ImmA/IrrE family metallo-endopeptidase [Leptolyngbya ohadii]
MSLLPYRHPGRAFLSRYGMLRREEDVFRYVDFLRQESGLSDEPPIALTPIYQHFGIPEPLRAPLDEQQGILVDSNSGIILIKEDDPIVRQRFTEGHELMELLFDAQLEAQEALGSLLPTWSEPHKERLCDRGAAELLMPQSSFVPRLSQAGISFRTGRSLAKRYQTSLVATLMRMLQYGRGNFALVMWHSALKPSEVKHPIADAEPQKKLRVCWKVQTQDWTGGFIPKDKSISPDSLIFQAYLKGQPQHGTEMIHLGWGSIPCEVEAMPLRMGDRSDVLSLLRFQDDRANQDDGTNRGDRAKTKRFPVAPRPIRRSVSR